MLRFFRRSTLKQEIPRASFFFFPKVNFKTGKSSVLRFLRRSTLKQEIQRASLFFPNVNFKQEIQVASVFLWTNPQTTLNDIALQF